MRGKRVATHKVALLPEHRFPKSQHFCNGNGRSSAGMTRIRPYRRL
jgi:hypothetical protein